MRAHFLKFLDYIGTIVGGAAYAKVLFSSRGTA
jgi:hypothetical protein